MPAVKEGSGGILVWAGVVGEKKTQRTHDDDAAPQRSTRARRSRNGPPLLVPFLPRGKAPNAFQRRKEQGAIHLWCPINGFIHFHFCFHGTAAAFPPPPHPHPHHPFFFPPLAADAKPPRRLPGLA